MAYSLEYYKRRLRSINNQINERNHKNDRIRGEIRELEQAYNTLGRIKRQNANNASNVRSNAKKSKVANGVQWRGKAKKDFDSIMDKDVERTAREFFNKIDQMHDQIGTELGRKRGEIDTGSFTLNSLNKTKNWLESTIRNWVN